MSTYAIRCPNWTNFLYVPDDEMSVDTNPNVPLRAEKELTEDAVFTLVAVGTPQYLSGPFTIGSFKFALMTRKGNFISFVKGGGINGLVDVPPPHMMLTTDVVDLVKYCNYEFVPLDKGFGKDRVNMQGRFAIKTGGGKYIHAVNGGGMGGQDQDPSSSWPIHTVATWAAAWETFTLAAPSSGSISQRGDAPVHLITPDGTSLRIRQATLGGSNVTEKVQELVKGNVLSAPNGITNSLGPYYTWSSFLPFVCHYDSWLLRQ